ncbi:hypothetical protein EYF80_057079 [Liparis tanakae]|uniref:Uncharacterized protein n=1 Tax=Liparis tanakae TaxID=230148 RepID=A0A4Z2EV98_9TELE|nr:hypothetical protein EYF80_057079 [Liparis tanakae]
MPSEDQQLRDRGPVPPVTRAGRSAQLAKAAAASPASERRTRGRPRKDGAGDRSVPPSPPPPPSALTTPASKSRMKVRSRGRAPVGDEELMDTTEKTPPKKTEVKEKTTGCRRSTSRRKSNANPEPDTDPSQDHLSQDPDPPHPDPTISEFSPDPASIVEEEDRTSPAPASPLPTSGPGPASGPGEGPPVSSPSPDLDLSLFDSPRSAPDPVNEDCHNHSPIETVTVEAEEPPLGQGRLVVFGPTPGYIPLHILNRRASSDRDNDCHAHCYRGDLAPPT